MFKFNSCSDVAKRAQGLVCFFLRLLQLFLELLDFFLNLFNLTGNFGRSRSALGRQQGFAAIRRAAPARVFRLQFRGVGLVNDQAVVVVELFTSFDIAQGF